MSAMAMNDAIETLWARKFDTSLEEEGARSVEVERLQSSVRAYWGHLMRVYNELRFLCSNSGSLSEFMSKNLVDLEEQQKARRNY